MVKVLIAGLVNWKDKKGRFKNDKMSGQGTFLYQNGDKYVGEFRNGKFHGQGTYLRVGEWEGNKYVGEFKT